MPTLCAIEAVELVNPQPGRTADWGTLQAKARRKERIPVAVLTDPGQKRFGKSHLSRREA